jgi:hypothetical protein
MLLMIFILFSSFLAGEHPERTASLAKKVVISQESRMFLEGYTNVNLYNCDCQDKFAELSMTIQNDGNHTVFHNANLKLRTEHFNCHNPIYNSNIKKILKADEFPYITIALLETWQDPELLQGTDQRWFSVRSKIGVTIQQTSKVETVNAKAQYLGANKFRIKGEQTLHMTDFGIEAPKYMCGLVKVKDEIVFNFDLVIEMTN